jgi:hypothetical protein
MPAPAGEPVLLPLPSPASVALNDILLAAGSQDVLRHLSAAEMALGPSSDRMSALSAHLLGQRSMYPLYPPHPSCCLDTTLDQHLQLPHTPDLLLLPSDLAPFARMVGLPALSRLRCGAAPSRLHRARRAVRSRWTAPAPHLPEPGRWWGWQRAVRRGGGGRDGPPQIRRRALWLPQPGCR